MKQIVCFGDSNTWGYDPKLGKRFGWGVRWTSILQERLGTDEYHVIEEGLCGRTTVFEDELRMGRRGMDALPFLLESHSPVDIIILMLGTNDCKTIYHTNENIIGKGIESLLEVIRRIQPETKILLVSPIFLGDDVWKSQFDPEFDEQSVSTSKKLKKVYKLIADRKQIEFLAASDYAIYSNDDMEHMDEENHLKFAEAVLEKLIEIGVPNE